MKNDGKLLETKIQQALVTFTQHHPGFKHRFYDTKSAGNYLPAQPGDFFLLIPNRCLLIEAKSTTVGASILKLAWANKQQLAKHKLWHRAGHPSWYAHLDVKEKILSWYKGEDILKRQAKPIWSGGLNQIEDSLNIITAI